MSSVVPLSEQPIDWKTIDDALTSWAGTESGLTAIWENQSIAQPFPYVSLNRTSGPLNEGGIDEIRNRTDLSRPAGAEIERVVVGPRAFTLTVHAHVDPESGGNASATEAKAIAGKLQGSLGKLSVLDLLRSAGVSVVDEMGVTDTSLVINGEWISRATMDVRLRTSSVVTEQHGYIDKVSISSDYGDADDSLDLDDEIFDSTA